MAAFLENMLGMAVSDTAALAFTVVALLVVLAIVWLLVRFFRQPRFAGKRGKQARLAITDAARIDDRRRLVLVRRDDVEHLIMIGGVTDLLIETDIRRTAPARALSQPEDEPQKVVEAAPLPPRVSREEEKPAPVEPEIEAKPAVKPAEWPAVPPVSRPVATASTASPNPAPAALTPQPVAAPPIPMSKPAEQPAQHRDLTDPAAAPAKATAMNPPTAERPSPSLEATPANEPAKRNASEEMEALLSGLKPTR